MESTASDARLGPFMTFGQTGRQLATLLTFVERTAALLLAIDVVVVFVSVICRYFLHEPLHWAEEVARSLMVMQVFLGAATVLGRSNHAGIDIFLRLFPDSWGQVMIQFASWIIVAVSVALFLSAIGLALDSVGQTTPIGLPQSILTLPVVFGSLLMVVFGIVNALSGPAITACATLAASLALSSLTVGWNTFVPTAPITPIVLLVSGFVVSLLIGVPIAFALAFAAMLYFLADPSLPMVIYAQQLLAGSDHFVLLAIPFFLLAGIAMEVNGMSSRLIELLLRMMGRVRGGFNLIMIVAVAFFSGVSGSKLADIAAVGGILMPAVRRTKQDPNEAAGLLAATAVMSETIPPCINMIIFGFVANVSIGGLFMAGLVPAAVLALTLAAVAIYVGKRVDPSAAYDSYRPMLHLIAGAMVAVVMVAMIGRGVMSGIATATEISAFAVVYALVVGGVAFRELSVRSVVKLFVDAAAMTGGILFIVAAASSLSYALTIEQIPQYLAHSMINLGHNYGTSVFLVVSVLLMIVFGAILEGAPALIIFGPLLTPIAAELGVHPLHFGTVMVIAMGLGLFSPPVGLGLFATCAITGTNVRSVARPMMKYLAVLFAGLLLIVFVPAFSLWLPGRLGYK